MSIGYIYKISNKINDKIYIGQTKYSIEKRWKEHLYNVDKRDQTLYLAMRKYQKDNFYIEQLEEVELHLLDEREIFWIQELKTVSPNGYNITSGGSFGHCNPMYIPEIAKKVSLKFMGNLNPAKRPEVREKIRVKALGRIVSKESREKMSKNNAKYWAHHPACEQMKNSFTEYHKLDHTGSNNPSAVPVARLDKKTEEILQEYVTIKAAIDWILDNTDRVIAQASNISQCVTGKQKTAFGFKWKRI